MSAPTGNAAATSFPSDTELVITRVFDAPRSLVFDAWTRPEHLEKWQMSPKDMTVTTEKSEIRPGGEYRVTMWAPDGTAHRLRGVYKEVVPPARLVFTHAWLDADGNIGKDTLVTVTFEERGTQTLFTLRQTGFGSVPSRDGHGTGWNSGLDKLEDYLATLAPTAA
ncbi:MAG: SRPBCC domain-containing protein [Gemmatimonadota bacterium]|nr:SRPBCC domain-containing protein [Gemmatimonadota bacterium]